jgi:hypothetical protein
MTAMTCRTLGGGGKLGGGRDGGYRLSVIGSGVARI